MAEWAKWIGGILFTILMAVIAFVFKRLTDLDEDLDMHVRDDRRHTADGISQAVMGHITENIRLQISALGAQLSGQIERVEEKLAEHVDWEKEWRAQFDREHRRNQS